VPAGLCVRDLPNREHETLPRQLPLFSAAFGECQRPAANEQYT
jgi:hypothetical protein